MLLVNNKDTRMTSIAVHLSSSFFSEDFEHVFITVIILFLEFCSSGFISNFKQIFHLNQFSLLSFFRMTAC